MSKIARFKGVKPLVAFIRAKTVLGDLYRQKVLMRMSAGQPTHGCKAGAKRFNERMKNENHSH